MIRPAIASAALLLLATPLQAIGVRRNVAPAPGPPLTVRVELDDQGERVIDQPVIGLVRRMGEVEIERDRFVIQPCPLGSGQDAFGQRMIYSVELGLAARRPEQGGALLTVRVFRLQNEGLGRYYRPKCSDLPVNNFSETVTRQIFLKRGVAQDLAVLPGLNLRLTLQ